MGTRNLKSVVKKHLRNGWLGLSDLQEAQREFERAHQFATPFVRLHTICHASLLFHAIVSLDRTRIKREVWLTIASGPVTLRNRVIRTLKQNRA